MIQANDLRIGNFVHSVEIGNEVIINSISDEGITFKNCVTFDYPTFEDITPIPLTEEILFKCGFFYDIDSDTYKISDCTLQIDMSDFEIPDAIVFGESLRYVRHLHQLQNLFFALTGKELEVKR
ncbi:hypothetical protein [Sphingobacterium deserti]|uniref:Uncharacterized protein n=1 Tax=Sphingobacterium deserti TaxID=1229276 RepID=A0A0B8T4F7_9SPHI|nr:hypothetical protein [Sphingobacterium deserti]KGE14598.1 hypothetical protein DI53_1627 [Sphingobacterium deserti]